MTQDVSEQRERVAPRAPPLLTPADGAAGLMMNALPMLGSVGSIVLITSTSAGGSGVLRMVAGGMFVLTTLGFVVVQVDRQRAQRRLQRRWARTAYLRHLAVVRRQLRAAAQRQRQRLATAHPDPGLASGLADLAGPGPPAAWRARYPTDGPLPALRWGRGDRAPGVDLVAPEEPEGEADPVAADALVRLLAAHRHVSDLPLTLDLEAVSQLDVVGGDARAVVRALVVSAALAAPPGRLRIAVVAGADALRAWDWVKWLPHAADPTDLDATGPRPLVGLAAPEPAAPEPGRPVTAHLLLVHESAAAPPAPAPGVTVLRPLASPAPDAGPRPGLVAHLELAVAVAGHDDRLTPAGSTPGHDRTAHDRDVRGRADRCGPAAAEAAARRLAPHTTARGITGATGTPTEVVTTVLGLRDPTRLDPGDPDGGCWRPRPAQDRLRVPVGTDPGGAAVHLDLKEAALGGTGPHGLVVGATGSGKSELLRTLVLGLAVTHSPAELNLVLVDYKGGATFAGLAALPHTSALITNLADESGLVERMGDALAGEVVRRQELLRAAGPFASRHDLEQARAAGARLPPLPSLLVVVDEFSELLAAEPAFVDLFGTIGRLGRSLGVHLLLASQRLEEGRLRGLESHLSYRVGLRTFSAAESRTVLGVPDAASLPGVPGVGFLRPAPDTLLRFTAAYVSGPVAAEQPARPPAGPRVVPFDVSVRVPETGRAPETEGVDGVATLLDAAVDRLAGHGPAAHRVWLPPLAESPALGDLLGGLVEDPHRGLVPRQRGVLRDRAGLALPLGVVDRPREQRRDPLLVDLATAGGHLVTVGGPRSGTSTLLRTAVTALALTTTPAETRCYVLDLGGGALAPLAALPHVASVVTRAEPGVVRRLLAELRGELDAREAGPGPRPRLVLVVDGWGALREGDGSWEQEVTALAARGPGLGLHVLAAATRWSDLRAAARDLFGHRVELRLGDPLDSEVDRRTAARVPPARPGRGIGPDGHHLLVALPTTAADRPEEELAARVAAAWPGARAPGLRLLPTHVDLAEVRRAAGAGTRARGGSLWLGIDEERLAPVGLHPDDGDHLLVLGDAGSGRTMVLRTLAREVVRTRTPDQAQLLVVDPRRSLLGELAPEHLLGHVSDEEQAQETVGDLAAFLRTRLPGRDVDAASLRRRDWWRGSEVWMLVDDHELLAPSAGGAPAGQALAPLVPLLPRARDVGLHVVVARRAGGAARTLHDPLLQVLRDLGAPALLLSAGTDEGVLLGLRPAPMPPGRGRLVTRERGVEVVQTAWSDPAA